MRSMLIATLALSPALLYAQAIVPAQPQAAGSVPALQSKLIAPKTFDASANLDRTTVPVERISTGVVPAKLIYSVAIPSEPNAQWRTAGKSRSAVVEMVVDEKGKPSDLKLIQSAGSDLDQSVLQAVKQYRFRPATVSSKTTPMTVALTVEILNPLAR
jgi:TonB family protein